MKGIRYKIIAGLLGLMLMLGLSNMAWMSWRASTNYLQLDQEAALADFDRLLRAFELRLHQDQHEMVEWLSWFRLARFTQGQDPAFEKDYLTPKAITQSGQAWLAVLDNQGQILKSVSTPDVPPLDGLLEGPYARFLRTMPGKDSGCKLGVVEQSWMVLCRRAIHEPSGDGKALGILVTAKSLTPETLAELSAQTGLLFTLSTRPMSPAQASQNHTELLSALGDAPVGIDIQEDVIRLQWPVHDLAQHIVGHLRMDWRRSFTLHARHEMSNLGWQLLICFLLIALGMLLMVDRLIVSRLARFDEELRDIYQHKHWDKSVSVEGDDEITALTNGTNSLLEIIGSQVKHLESLAETDPLTALANKRSFDDVLQRALLTSRRYKRPLSLVVLDVDHFKLYNDRYGHAEGDFALQTVAQCLQGQARRPGDFCARIGGEEFAVILEDTELAGAVHWMQTTQQRLAELELPHEDNSASPYLSVSAGVALAQPQDDASKLFKRADAALYQAKADGRNRVVSA